MNTITYDEYQLLRYELLKLHNDLTDIGARLDNENVVHRMHDARYSIRALLDTLKSQNIIG